ncbi:unnamed protein product [Hydatigera taeniaeformis]|uniref:HD_domain domain-containing protein n=1 Tax=Hydatigena taeniaeformis TaxID=6205 RepID=A0A0R3WW41_HYDTA|nr:unnamed protein product [Hydatigera taeniaeformis]VDM26466.1 unnamed protein product [Hydatigera taeniaeformis]
MHWSHHNWLSVGLTICTCIFVFGFVFCDVQEYEEQKTPEAVVCKDLDKFEMILQAYEYELEAQRAGWLSEFFKTTEGCFTYPCVREWVAALVQLRSASRREGGRKE